MGANEKLGAALHGCGCDEELEQLNDKLADILRRTANALKGKPEPMTEHSWHDLPEIAAQHVAAVKAVRKRLDRTYQEAHAMTCEVNEKRRAIGIRLFREVKKIRERINEALGEQ